MFDLDFFKHVNGDYGHDIGDKVLVTFAKCLTECIRDYDIVGSIGGDEFAVFVPDTSIDDALLACERLRANVECIRGLLNNDYSKEISITVSVGVASNKSAYDKCSNR